MRQSLILTGLVAGLLVAAGCSSQQGASLTPSAASVSRTSLDVTAVPNFVAPSAAPISLSAFPISAAAIPISAAAYPATSGDCTSDKAAPPPPPSKGEKPAPPPKPAKPCPPAK
jgi:hypothetical protein